MFKRYNVAYLSLLVTSVFLIVYNVNVWNSKLAACASQSGNTGQLPEVTSPLTPTQQRWKTRVEASCLAGRGAIEQLNTWMVPLLCLISAGWIWTKFFELRFSHSICPVLFIMPVMRPIGMTSQRRFYIKIDYIKYNNEFFVRKSSPSNGFPMKITKETALIQHSSITTYLLTKPPVAGNCTLTPVVPTWDNYFDTVVKQEKCTNMRYFGGPTNFGKGDGAKSLCMDSGMTPQKNDCTVMSFGINIDWSFDDAMAAWGCEVYSFDPTIAQNDHLRGKRIHFHNLGLSGKKGIISYNKMKFPVDSYRGVLEHVGLINKTIDYLKIDVEGSEIEFFENVLYEDTDALQHVKQLGVEIHVFNQTVQSRDKFWKIFHRLECLGFRKVYSEQNTNPPTAYVYNKIRPVSCCYELVWINEAFI